MYHTSPIGTPSDNSRFDHHSDGKQFGVGTQVDPSSNPVYRRGKPVCTAIALSIGTASRYRCHRPGPAMPVPFFELRAPVQTFTLIFRCAGGVFEVCGPPHSQKAIRRAVADA